MKVLYKGLTIVAVPLVLELALIGGLACVLQAAEKEEASANYRRALAGDGARLIFADGKAGVHLILAWNQRNPDVLSDFYLECERIDALMARQTIRYNNGGERSKIGDQGMESQRETSRYLREIGELTRGGFQMENVRRLMIVQKQLIKHLNSTMGMLHEYYLEGLVQMKESSEHLRAQQQQSYMIVLAGFIFNLAAAFLLFRFFQKWFVFPIGEIRANITKLGLQQSLKRSVPGTDEIAALDKAVVDMGTELERAAARERSLFNNSSDVICVLDEGLRITRINQAAQKMWEQSPEALTGKALFDVTIDNAVAATALTSRPEEGRPVTFELVVDPPEGDQVQTLWSAVWSPSQHSWYCTVTDISAQRKLEAMRQSFLKLVAADFQRPLKQMAQLLQGLDSRPLPDGARTKVGNSTKTLNRLAGLVDELLELETAHGALLSLQVGDVKAKDLVAEAVSDTESVAKQRSLKLAGKCPPEVMLPCDGGQIVRVLINFLSNAIKFSPEGGTVSIDVTEADGWVSFSVTDQGRGIPEEAKGKLFQAFSQVETADGKRGKGTGLGLVVCKRIVEQHGGKIGFDSIAGSGSTFWFKLPLLPAVQTDTTGVAQEASIGSVSSGPVRHDATTSRAISVHGAMRGGESSAKGFNLKAKGKLLVVIPLLFETIFVVAMMFLLLQSGEQLDLQLQRRDVVLSAVRMSVELTDLSLVVRKAAHGQSKNEYGDRLKHLPEMIERFKTAAGKDNFSRQYLPNIEAVFTEVYRLLGHYNDRLKESLTPAVLDGIADRMLLLSDRLSDQVVVLLDASDKRDAALSAPRELKQYQKTLLIGGLIVSSLAAAALAAFFGRDVASRLKVMSQNAYNLAEGRPLSPPVAGSDEIAVLDRAFHETAERLGAARAKERAFLDFSPSIISALNVEGKFTAINPTGERIFGCTPGVMQSTLEQLVLAESAEAVREALTAAKFSEQPAKFDVKVLSGEKTLDLAWSVSWSESEQSFFAVAHDVTARKELERTKKEFLSLITHDLRTPLTTIMGTMELTQSGAYGEIAPDVDRVLERVRMEAKNILELVNDLLDFEKLEAGQLKLEFAQVTIARVIAAVERLAAERAVNVNLDGGCEATLRVDMDRLSQALLALLQEARISAGQLRIAVEQNEDDVVLEITCAGSRNEPEKIQAASARFAAMDPLAAQQSGSRLRLPLARKVLRLHESSLDFGTNEAGDLCITVRLPGCPA